MFAAVGPLAGRDAYALWAIGLAAVCLTLFQASRVRRPGFKLPGLTGAHLSTIVAWLLIGIAVAYLAIHYR